MHAATQHTTDHKWAQVETRGKTDGKYRADKVSTRMFWSLVGGVSIHGHPRASMARRMVAAKFQLCWVLIRSGTGQGLQELQGVQIPQDTAVARVGPL